MRAYYYCDYKIKGYDESYESEYIIGMYGEDLLFTKLEDNKWIFSSLVLDLWDLYMDDETKRKFLVTYTYYGYRYFNTRFKNFYDFTFYRIDHLSEALHELFLNYKTTNSIDAYKRLELLLYAVDIFKMNKKSYYYYFIDPDRDDFYKYVKEIYEIRKRMRKKIKEYKNSEAYKKACKIHGKMNKEKYIFKYFMED